MNKKHRKMNRFNLILFLIISIFIEVGAQDITPEMLGFSEYTLSNDGLGNVNYFISKSETTSQKPLLVYLDGSGPYPLFQKLEKGIGSTVVINFQELSKKYRILLISKPGIPFIDKVSKNENGFPKYEPTSEYIEKLSLDWRVNSANRVINHILENEIIKTEIVIAMGFSEGAQVVPKLASINKQIDAIMLFSGNGLTQLYDPLLSARINAAKGRLSEIEAQKQIDSLFKTYKEILKHPENTERKWYGHTYKRWASFAKNEPLKYLLQLNIPIYLVNGSLDENPVSSADYIQLEFIRHAKDNLTYKTYPNYSHQFNELSIENNQVVALIPKINEVMDEAFNWLQNKLEN